MSFKDMVPFKERTAGELRPFEYIGRALEDLFDLDLLRRPVIKTPQIDIRETDKTVEVSMALPGADRKDIKLDLTEDTLAVACEHREEKEERGADGYRAKERSYGRFYRSFTLPSPVKTGDAKAVYKEGVLKITLQKLKTDRTRQITVE